MVLSLQVCLGHTKDSQGATAAVWGIAKAAYLETKCLTFRSVTSKPLVLEF